MKGNLFSRRSLALIFERLASFQRNVIIVLRVPKTGVCDTAEKKKRHCDIFW